MKKIKDRYQAESLFCELFVKAGRKLGVSEFGEQEETPKHTLSAAAVKVIHDCEFGDPDFIGGPAIFNFAKSHDDVDRIFLRAAPIATELSTALEKYHPEHAKDFQLNLSNLKSWLHKNVDKWAT